MYAIFQGTLSGQECQINSYFRLCVRELFLSMLWESGPDGTTGIICLSSWFSRLSEEKFHFCWFGSHPRVRSEISHRCNASWIHTLFRGRWYAIRRFRLVHNFKLCISDYAGNSRDLTRMDTIFGLRIKFWIDMVLRGFIWRLLIVENELDSDDQSII